MDWLQMDVELDAAAAVRIAQGMRAVALADGQIHPQELALIAGLEASLPRDAQAKADLSGEEQELYLRSLIFVALADGRMSAAEANVIGRLADEAGIPAEQVRLAETELKRRFVGYFAGVARFRDAVVKVAEELGVEGPELDGLRGEA